MDDPGLEIEDRPRFSWRGSHLDVGRHFMPKVTVLRHIDLLALHKLNVFHWHLTVFGVGDKVLKFLENVLEEVLSLFPSKFIHVAGDECPKVEWKESAAAQARMREFGLRDEDELQSWFITHFDKWLAARGRRLIGWDQILEGGLAPGATVMSWRGEKGGIAAANAGHDVVLAPEKRTYFDYDNSEDEPLKIRRLNTPRGPGRGSLVAARDA